MDLKYTPRTINEIEVEAKRPVQEVLAEYSMKNIVLFVKKGLGVDEEKAFDEIDKYLKDNKDTIQLYTLIMEKLQEAGFLPRKLNLKKIKSDMNKAISEGV
jgi:hypothetical protein